MELDPGDPLDPDEAAPARRDEADGGAVAVAERLVADVGGEQQLARVVAVEAPAVAGVRDHAHVAPGAVAEQAVQARAAPALGGVEAAGAVERGGQLVARVELERGQAPLAEREGVVGVVERLGRVRHPRRRRERVALEGGDLVGAGEAAPGGGQPGRALQLPERERARPDPGAGDHLAPGQVTAARALRPLGRRGSARRGRAPPRARCAG